MSLIQDVQRLCRRLAPLGWGELFAAHGLDITAADLGKELARSLRRIDRKLPGFEDFCAEGVRGIEPGSPAKSLLYHALASSGVATGPEGALRAFPTLAELDRVENYVFATRRATLESLRALAGEAPLAVAVFACEYRTAPRTAHKRYADLTFSRTGLCRIGTAPPRYDARLRGFSPLVAGRTDRIRVSPARFSAYLAIRLPGAPELGRPMRYRKPIAHTHAVGDNRRGFWVPLHKLFSGPECLSDVPELTVGLSARQINEKIRRIHLALARRTVHGKKFKSGWAEPDISRPPFRFSEGIAEWSTSESDPPGLLVPVPHPTLVEPAIYRGQPLGFNVPSRDGFLATLDITVEHNDEGEEIRSAPAYIHARTRMTAAGEVDLNQFSNVAGLVTEGGYRARHYVDRTGDGWVKAKLGWGKARPARGLAKPLPAFSLVTAPDFLYACDQAELSEWTEALPKEVRHRIWYMAPTPLSDERLPANLQMPGSPFAPDDDTITAVVAMGPAVAKGKPVTRLADPHPIHTSLPDDAAGVMAPGWDVSRDWLPDHRQHLASYGLGSPFPEDSKLCAALSSFWPAVAPDATREFAWPETQGYKSVTPLTDEEIGLGAAPPWDAVPPPRLVTKDDVQHVVYSSFQHADYALCAVANKLTLAGTGRITQQEYADRTLAMATVYRALGSGHFRWAVLSYRQVGAEDRERHRAEKATGHALQGIAHRFAMYLPGEASASPKPPFRQQLRVRRRATLLVVPGSDDVLIERLGKWVRKRVSWA
jgi:hypothetical protein